MANTLPDVVVSAGVWTDLYAATGISVGTALMVYNKGSAACFLAIGPTAPSTTNIGIPITSDSAGNHKYISSGESGVWAYNTGSSSNRLSVQGV